MKNITLELSAKAFSDNTTETLYTVCRKLFKQYEPLTRTADRLSVLLWLADGSEILEYQGRMDQPFEWACWIGTASPESIDPEDRRDLSRSLSHHPLPYRPDPEPRTCGWIKKLISVLRETAERPIRIGATFDPGPEFAYSPFRLKKHPEINRKLMGFNSCFIHVNSRLHADSHAYAGFPDGIAEGTHFGTFLGRQFRHYAGDLGFDYLWLSNGIGFGFETWRIQGALFDGHRYSPENIAKNQVGLCEFWSDLRNEVGDLEIQTRGSNLTAGVEMGSDAAPIRDIYREYKPVAPVNSPWAAINYDVGVELAGYMSHVAEPPTDRMPFRYYIHDPWWLNSPWLDRYEREPWDIYLPLSIAALGPDGEIRTADSISIFSADNSRGEMPDKVPREVLPHLLEAAESAPDDSGPLIWLYCFDEYHDLVFGNEPHPEAPLGEDLFISSAIQEGLPLNTVISSRSFMRKFPPLDRILIAPLSGMRGALVERMLAYLELGARVVFYGAARMADSRILKRLGIALSNRSTEGVVELKINRPGDTLLTGRFASTVRVRSQVCCGPLCEIADGCEVLASGAGHVLAARNGNLMFLRSIVPHADPNAGCVIRPASTCEYPYPRLFRQLLAEFGFRLEQEFHHPEQPGTSLCVSRHAGACRFSVFCPDTTVKSRIRFPLGVPVPMGMNVLIENDCGTIQWERSTHRECRFFVDRCEDSVVTAREEILGYPDHQRHIQLTGLKNASVNVLTPSGEIRRHTDQNGILDVYF